MPVIWKNATFSEKPVRNRILVVGYKPAGTNQGRFGSLITDVEIPTDHRPDKEFRLNKYNGTCGKCVEKCVTGALTENGQDRHVCYSILLVNMDHYEDEGMADVCGKCAGVVPCSYHNPVKAEAK